MGINSKGARTTLQDVHLVAHIIQITPITNSCAEYDTLIRPFLEHGSTEKLCFQSYHNQNFKKIFFQTYIVSSKDPTDTPFGRISQARVARGRP